MRSRDNQRGFILISLYLLLTLLMAHGVVLLGQAMADVRAAQGAQASVQAYYLAEGGVDQAIAGLRTSSNWAGGGQALGRTGSYNVQIEDLGANRVRLMSLGNADTVRGTVTRSLETVVQLSPGGSYPPGLFGDKRVDLRGSVRVDSYDSSLPLFLPTRRGQVGTNGVRRGAVRIVGSTAVFGDVHTGPGAPPEAVRLIGASVVTGEVGPMAESILLPPVDEPRGTEDRRVTGVEQWPAGIHRFRKLTITGSARLSFEGPAVLVVKELRLSGNSVTTPGNIPENLIIKVKGSGDVRLTGVSNLRGVIYAPRSDVRFSGSNRIFGSVTGRKIKGTGSIEVWYDEALEDAQGGGSENQVQVLSWRESF